MQRMLDGVERVGNKVPHPAVIFIALIVILILLSQLMYMVGASATFSQVNPSTNAIEETTAAAKSLLTAEGIRFMYSSVIQNFMDFNAVGVIIVAMFGVGVADSSGLIAATIRKLVHVAPARFLTYILVFIGIMSSIAADAGYLVLIPLAAAAFVSVGRHPLAGLGASFAGVASVFSVNILIKPLDGILTEMTNDAIHLLKPNESIQVTANVWFSVASVVMLTVVVSLITDKFVEPRLGAYAGETPPASNGMSVEESRGLKYAMWGVLGVLGFFALVTLPSRAPLRNAETGSLVENSPFLNGLISFIALTFLVAGAAYGAGARTMTSVAAVIKAMEKAVAGLGGLILLLFIISQFLAYFTYTNIATIAAVRAGDTLERAGWGPLPLLVGFAVIVAVITIVLTPIIPKWAVCAPIFIPLLMRLGIGPDAVLAAYRVGDAPFNAITPLNPYFAIIVAFAAKYDKDAGVGTVIALMLPYVVVVLALWILLLAAWQVLGLPWGF